MGPRRADRDDIKTFWAPELQERWFACEELDDLPEMVGGSVPKCHECDVVFCKRLRYR